VSDPDGELSSFMRRYGTDVVTKRDGAWRMVPEQLSRSEL
jgi:hypothetical protein